MSHSITTLAFLCIAWAATCADQDPNQADSTKASSERRMKVMRKRVASLKAVGPSGEEYQFGKKPLLRYDDPVRDIVDASLWSLGRTGRPKAVLVLEVYEGTYLQYELTGTSDLPKSVQADTWRWTPNRTDFTWSKIQGQVPPDPTKGVRRRQLKQLARKFGASEEFRGQTHELRLMPQPIHHYEEPTNGITDGAVFVWAHGTNVEILMFLEARNDEESKPSWVVGFSRLAAAKLDVTFLNKKLWTSPASSGNQTQAYFFRGDNLTQDERAAFTSPSCGAGTCRIRSTSDYRASRSARA